MNYASMCPLVFATICALIVGCSVAPQPESIKSVAAFEVPLQSKADREEFLSVLRDAAQAEGMHVDAESDTDLGSEATLSPKFKMTMKAAVWRGSNDDEAVASAIDQRGGPAFLVDFRGRDKCNSIGYAAAASG